MEGPPLPQRYFWQLPARGGWSRMNHPRRILRLALRGDEEGGPGAGGHRRLSGARGAVRLGVTVQQD